MFEKSFFFQMNHRQVTTGITTAGAKPTCFSFDLGLQTGGQDYMMMLMQILARWLFPGS
jgi:hypothetical protein